MNTDIRLDVTFVDHPKTIRLVAAIGERAIRCLLRLWTRAAASHPSGDLTGLTDREIALMASWPGKPPLFVQALIEIGFLDGDPGARQLHGWSERQPYASHSPERSAAAKKAADARWNARRNTDRMRSALPKGNAPAPFPSPSPTDPPPNPPADAGGLNPSHPVRRKTRAERRADELAAESARRRADEDHRRHVHDRAIAENLCLVCLFSTPSRESPGVGIQDGRPRCTEHFHPPAPLHVLPSVARAEA